MSFKIVDGKVVQFDDYTGNIVNGDTFNLNNQAGLGPTNSAAISMDVTGINPLDTADTGTGIMDYLNANQKGIGTITQGIGLGYGLYDNIWGNSAKSAKKEMQLMDQQIASNKQSMADTAKFNKTWANASNKATGLGTVA